MFTIHREGWNENKGIGHRESDREREREGGGGGLRE